MDSEEELAAAVVAYILENKKKEKNGKTLYLSKTLAHAKRCSWFLQHSYVRIKDKRCGGIYQISMNVSLFVWRIVATYRNWWYSQGSYIHVRTNSSKSKTSGYSHANYIVTNTWSHIFWTNIFCLQEWLCWCTTSFFVHRVHCLWLTNSTPVHFNIVSSLKNEKFKHFQTLIFNDH